MSKGASTMVKIAILDDDSNTLTSEDWVFTVGGYGFAGLAALKGGTQPPAVIDLGNLPAGEDTGAPWEGDTLWVQDPAQVVNDGELVDGAARFPAVAGAGTTYHTAFQLGTLYDGVGAVVTERPQGPHNQNHIALLKIRWSGPDATRDGIFYYRWTS